jgi:tRNA1(Val) A37 N6-methylase TrmN6
MRMKPRRASCCVTPRFSEPPLETSDNRVLGGRILLRQPVKGFRSGSDAVLLAAASHPPRNGRIVELGCGTGSAMLCVACRRPDVSFTGIEIDSPTAELAEFNIRRNGMSGIGRVIPSDIAGQPLSPGSVDLVLANPPYFVEGRHRRSPDVDRDRARAETVATLSDWIETAIELLVPGGEAVFILRTERIGEARAALPAKWHLQALSVLGNPDKPPKRSLIRFSRRALPISAAAIPLHHSGGEETCLAQAIFRHAAPIFWR